MRFISKHDWWGVGLNTVQAIRGTALPLVQATDGDVFDPTTLRDELLLSYHAFKFTCIE